MEELLKAAKTAQGKAYAPYSGFQVGASILGASGAVYSGCNVENAAFPEGICAEGSAIAAMIMAGEKCITEVLVIGSGSTPCAPCGGCRQKLSEFAGGDTPVHMLSASGVRETVNLGELLPYGFGPADLER